MKQQLKPNHWFAIILAAAVTLAACGGAADEIIGLTGDTTSTSSASTTSVDSTSSSGDTSSSSSSTADSSTTTTAPVPPEVTAEVIRLLTVRTTSVDCTNLVRKHGGEVIDGVYAFNIAGLKGVAPMGPRRWSDAIQTPAKGDNPQQMLEDVMLAVCRDPLFGVTVAHDFATLRVDDTKVRNLNNWLRDWFASFEGDVTRLNEEALKFAPLVDADPEDVSQAQAKDAIDANLQYQLFAERVNTLITRFHLVGVQSIPSTRNYHLVTEQVVRVGLPDVGINPRQETLPALVLELTVKDTPCVPFIRIGYNVGDKRPERFAPPVCVPPTTTTTTGRCVTNCGGTTTTTRGCVTNCGGTTTTTVGTTTTTSCESGKCEEDVPTTVSTSPPNTGSTTPTTRPTPTTDPPTTATTAHPPPPTTLAPDPLTCEEREAQGLPLPPRCL